MTTSSAHFGSYPLVRPLTLPAPRSVPWATITASLSRAFGRLASAATVSETTHTRNHRSSWLDQATMGREIYRL
ncbi:Uncharacterised protein [Mycolicibacterium chitae]|uniref:Uncharacterized protein n=1 Tax=Mycolicibacterium chitae TaxID=1792 RepID=A0A448HXP7_MYCCI|nr:Uncharacterised protein [Mycolicibacterium chitae]